MTLPKHVGPEKQLSGAEVSALRGLMGSLSWPAVQSSPHLQASTSMLAGDVSKGLASTVFEANRLLKFAKLNSDVGLSFAPLGPLADCRLVTAFDASFCSRTDGSSQGGFLVLLAPKRSWRRTKMFTMFGIGVASSYPVWPGARWPQRPKLLDVQAMLWSLLVGTTNI